jgi:uncharacterized membrane protein
MVWNVVIAASVLLLHLIIYPIVKDPISLTAFGDLAQGLALLVAAIYFTRAAMHAEDHELRFKIFIALGFWIWFMGHALLSYSELLLERAATGTVTDAIWLIGYFFILRSIYLALNQMRSTSASSTRLEILSPLVIGLLVCAILLERLNNQEQSPLVRFEQVLFPFLDLWISTLAFLLAYKTGKKSWLLSGFGSLIIGIADLIFPFFEEISSPVYRYLDIPLFAGYSLWWLQAVSFTSAKSLNPHR